jgi:hypothetical protein
MPMRKKLGSPEVNIVEPRALQISDAAAMFEKPQRLFSGVDQESQIGALLPCPFGNPPMLLALIETHVARKNEVLNAERAAMKVCLGGPGAAAESARSGPGSALSFRGDLLKLDSLVHRSLKTFRFLIWDKTRRKPISRPVDFSLYLWTACVWKYQRAAMQRPRR